MEIFQIRYFISAATLGSFSTAAIENNISQSSFSKQIMSLEAELGVALFSRKNRSISLTPAGLCFLDHAYAIVSTYNRMRLALAQYSESDCVTINLGSIPVMPQYGITDAIIEFRTLHPKIHFNLIESESAQVVNGLRKMESDFAILRTDYLDPTIYDMTPLVNDRLIILMSEKHPMAKRNKLKLAELKDEKFIVPTIYSDLHTICINACLKAGFNPNICYTVSGKPEITFDFVRKNEAISLAMEKVMGYFPMSGCKLIPLEEDIYSKTALVWLKSVEMNSACRLFKNYLMYRMHA